METLNQEQREGFVRLLQGARQQQDKLFQEELESETKDEFLPKVLQRRGIADVVDKIGRVGVELTDSARALRTVDIFGRPNGLWSRLTKTEDANEALDRMKRPYVEEHEQSMKEYDRAMLRVLSAQTVDEAREVV